MRIPFCSKSALLIKHIYITYVTYSLLRNKHAYFTNVARTFVQVTCRHERWRLPSHVTSHVRRAQYRIAISIRSCPRGIFTMAHNLKLAFQRHQSRQPPTERFESTPPYCYDRLAGLDIASRSIERSSCDSRNFKFTYESHLIWSSSGRRRDDRNISNERSTMKQWDCKLSHKYDRSMIESS